MSNQTVAMIDLHNKRIDGLSRNFEKQLKLAKRREYLQEKENLLLKFENDYNIFLPQKLRNKCLTDKIDI